MTYFNLISTVACDKAKEHAEKKKPTQLATSLQTSLVQFAQCEKNYFSLIFLEQKWFGRRDPLRNTYATLEGELRNSLKQQTKLLTGEGGQANIQAVVSDQLASFCLCRIDCIEVFESCLRSSVSFKEVETAIAELLKKHDKKFSHPVLKSISSAINAEMKTLQLLVNSSTLISERKFFPSLMQLHVVHQTMVTWQPLLSKEQSHTYSFRTGLFGFGEKHATSSVSALYEWMDKFYQSLVSKFSFYFFGQLSRQGKPEEMKSVLAKTSYDYVAKCQNFCKKIDPSHVLLVSELDEPLMVPHEAHAGPRTCFEVPNPCPGYIFLEVTSFMKSKVEEITAEKVVYHYSKEIDCSFYVAQTDPGVTLVIVAIGRKSEKDSYILNFVNDVIGRTKPKRILSLLRPGSK